MHGNTAPLFSFMHESCLRSYFIEGLNSHKYCTISSTQVTDRAQPAAGSFLILNWKLWVDLSTITGTAGVPKLFFTEAFVGAASLDVAIQRSLFWKHWPSRNVLWVMLPLYCPWERVEYILHNTTATVCSSWTGNKVHHFQPALLFLILTRKLHVTHTRRDHSIRLCCQRVALHMLHGGTADTVIPLRAPSSSFFSVFVTSCLAFFLSCSLFFLFPSRSLSSVYIFLFLLLSLSSHLSLSASPAIGSYGDRSPVRSVLLLW